MSLFGEKDRLKSECLKKISAEAEKFKAAGFSDTEAFRHAIAGPAKTAFEKYADLYQPLSAN